MPIIIEEYNPGWTTAFQALKAVFKQRLCGLVDDIQHVGSTSVPGLAAKPIIDIDLIVNDRSRSDAVIEALASLGYEHLGDLGISGREAFRRSSAEVPLDGSFQTWPEHNLYLCPADCIGLKNHLALRDFLRAHPEAARRYSELKKALAKRHPDNIDAYVEGKSAFISDILLNAGLDGAAVEQIAAENRARII